VWLSPTIIAECLKQVWTEYGSHLGESRSRESVSVLAGDLFNNNKHPLPPLQHDNDNSGPGGSNWRNWFGGPRLRWEMIGMLFTWAGFAFKCSQEWAPVFDLPELQGVNRHTAAAKMQECSVACLKLCESSPEINTIMVCLMKNSVKLESNIINDESDRLNIGFGTVMSAFITVGLHRFPASEKVTAFSQYQSCLSASMYFLDKNDSLFNATPPSLTCRYCYCPIPLDICEEDLYSNPERLAAAVARLDSNGWNKDGKIYPTTWLRALCLQSPIREGILEHSLSVKLDFTKADIDRLISQLEIISTSYPPHIQYPKYPQWTENPSDMYIISRIQLDVLQCQFLLQRLLVSRNFCSGQELFNISIRMTSIILSVWMNRDRLQNFHFAFDWMLVSYGFPCVGILCVELLRSSELVPGPAPSSVYPPVQISRSEVVRTLTMFMAFLDWIRPTDNNAQLHRKLKKVIKRILDIVLDSPHLNPHPVNHHQQAPSTDPIDYQAPQQQRTTAFDVEQFDPTLLLVDDLDWLNEVDWTDGHW